MKTSRFSEQIAFVLRQAEEGTAIAEVCRKAGISEAMFYDRARPRHGARKSIAVVEHARCRRGDARGSLVSPGRLLQDQLVQRQVRHTQRSRMFSVSRSLRRFTWSLFNPPYSHR